MRAVVYKQYGTPDVLQLEELEKPAPGNDEVLVKVKASCINSWDWDLLRGTPFVNRLMAGILKPKRINILGCDVAGRVEAIGINIKNFKPGDEVYGDLSGCGWGGFAEYVSAPETALALKPACLTFEEAAAVPQAALLAMQGLCDAGRMQPGQKVLINGAGGGAGTFAIQIAKASGAEVTGVDSTEKLEIMRLTGADHVIDYTKQDITRNSQQYDLVLDMAGYRSVYDYKRILSPEGVYVMAGGASFNILRIMLVLITGNRKFRILLHKPNKGLDDIKELLETGKVVPVIDKCYPLSEVPDALLYFAAGHAKGKVIILL